MIRYATTTVTARYLGPEDGRTGKGIGSRARATATLNGYRATRTIRWDPALSDDNNLGAAAEAAALAVTRKAFSDARVWTAAASRDWATDSHAFEVDVRIQDADPVDADAGSVLENVPKVAPVEADPYGAIPIPPPAPDEADTILADMRTLAARALDEEWAAGDMDGVATELAAHFQALDALGLISEPTPAPAPARPSDTLTLDRLAVYLGSAEDWNGGDICELLAEMIAATGRPHPGSGDPDTYTEEFKVATGRRVPWTWVHYNDPNDVIETTPTPDPYAAG